MPRVVRKMQLAHNVNSMLLHQRKVAINGVEHLIEKTRYDYYQPNSENHSLFKVKNIETWSPSGGWNTKKSYMHNKYGRIIQLTDTNDVHISYIWGYKYKYPLMMAKNATFSQLEQAVSAKGLVLPNLSESITYNEHIYDLLLASVNSLPHSLVEVYKFKPNIGLSEQTMPNSLKTYYDYDGYGRLVSIADSKRHIVKQGEYNLVSIAPLSATMSCHDLYINDTTDIRITADGGTHTYQFLFRIYDKQNNNYLVYEITNDSGFLDIIPKDEGIESGYYQVQCEVSDLISGEKELLCQDVYVKPAKLRFSNIDKDYLNGNFIYSASIYTDSPTNVTFGLELATNGSCTVTIAGSSYTFNSEKETELTVSLTPGNNMVSIEFPTTVAIFEANMWIKIATNNHEIGLPNSLSISY